MSSRTHVQKHAGGSSPVPLPQLIALYLVYFAIAWLNVKFVFPWVNTNLNETAVQRLAGAYLPHAILLIVCVGMMILLWGRLTFRRLGLVPGGWRAGLIVTLAFWLLTNLLYLLQVGQSGLPFTASDGFVTGFGIKLFVDLLVTQLIGNALLEEIVFRGYFFQQLEIRFAVESESGRRWRKWFGIWAAGLISLVLFVALHIPIRLDAGIIGSDLLANLFRVAVWGGLFTILFAMTRNLWLVIGVHALVNRPCLWIESDVGIRLVQLVSVVLLLLIVFGLCIFRRRKKS